MPNGTHDTEFVTFGRWQAEHDRLRDQLRDTDVRVEQQIAALRADFEEFVTTTRAGLSRRRDRQWTLIIAFVTGLVLPLLVLAVVALATTHLH